MDMDSGFYGAIDMGANIYQDRGKKPRTFTGDDTSTT